MAVADQAGPTGDGGFWIEEIDPKTLGSEELRARVLELDRQASRLDQQRREALAELDATCAYADDGAPSAAAWYSARASSVSAGAARAEVRVGRRLRHMPGTEAAARSGRLGSAKVKMLAEVVDPTIPAVVEAFERDEQVLVRQAASLSTTQCSRLFRHWRGIVDDQHTEGDLEAQREQRKVSMSQSFGGLWHLEGTFDAETGAQVASALEATTQSMFRSDQTSAEAVGEPTVGAVRIGGRTAAQRRADAFAELCRQGLSAVGGACETRPVVPLIVATVDVGTLEARAGRPASVEGTQAELSPEALRRLACDARVSRLITDGDSEPLDVGRATRTISPSLRRALNHRDQGCVFPGCDRPPGWCHAHHLVHWAAGGETSPDNLALLCSHHHHAVHEGGYRLSRAPNGSLHCQRPDGTPLEARPNP